MHRLFKDVTKEEIARTTGEIDILIGFEHAGFHPQKEQFLGHFLLLKNQFGRCIGGTHPQIKEINERHKLNSVQVLHTTSSSVEDFYNIENLETMEPENGQFWHSSKFASNVLNGHGHNIVSPKRFYNI